MRKSEEVANPNSCWNKAKDDEHMFILLGRDRAAVCAVRRWCMMRLELGMNQSSDDKIIEAREWANTVEAELNKRDQSGN